MKSLSVRAGFLVVVRVWSSRSGLVGNGIVYLMSCEDVLVSGYSSWGGMFQCRFSFSS